MSTKTPGNDKSLKDWFKKRDQQEAEQRRREAADQARSIRANHGKRKAK